MATWPSFCLDGDPGQGFFRDEDLARVDLGLGDEAEALGGADLRNGQFAGEAHLGEKEEEEKED